MYIPPEIWNCVFLYADFSKLEYVHTAALINKTTYLVINNFDLKLYHVESYLNKKINPPKYVNNILYIIRNDSDKLKQSKYNINYIKNYLIKYTNLDTINPGKGYITEMPNNDKSMCNYDFKYQFKLHNNLITINKKLHGLIKFRCENMYDINKYATEVKKNKSKSIFSIYKKMIDIHVLISVPGFILHLIKLIF